MKRSFPPEIQTKFGGTLRHYHRSGSQTQRTWEDWVDGDAAKPGPRRNWLKILGIVISLLALGGIIAGLIIELS